MMIAVPSSPSLPLHDFGPVRSTYVLHNRLGQLSDYNYRLLPGRPRLATSIRALRLYIRKAR
jgi:hypothetical protein